MSLSITVLLVAVTALVSIGAFQDRRVFEELLYQPYAVRARGQWYRLFTHAFIHADWPHLAVNMFVLYMFGRNVEMLFALVSPVPPTLAYLGLYVGGVLFAALPGLAKHSADPGYRSVGASGAVSAVLFAQILLLPTRQVSVLLVPIAMPAWVFGILYLAYSWYMDKRGGDHVAHDAHFYGAVFGIGFTTALHPDLLFHLGSFERSLGY
ncbi:MAG TPA: rhomboid family intramembrane serine protease [Flavobacteriales bacterium]|nr:rhomboid family intramembrane serine protease [Flavobacteriales bacterium]